jgi:RND superfamily putative drug exporter
MMQEMGFGLAIAVLIDATIVRSVMVPSTMELLGDWNWYLPRWLQWLPVVRFEGGQVPMSEVPSVGTKLQATGVKSVTAS